MHTISRCTNLLLYKMDRFSYTKGLEMGVECSLMPSLYRILNCYCDLVPCSTRCLCYVTMLYQM